ncbi:MAG: TonB-dependent receptor [Alphaproteobacteria bacterium]|nr:TonB-dependent receptor [Alphaproteobacteria bacterium]
MSTRAALLTAAAFALPVLPHDAAAQMLNAQPEQVVVYGTLPGSEIMLSAAKVPGMLQSLDGDRIGARHGASLLDSLGQDIAGVSLSDLQGNAIAQNLRYRGFEASPLQGTPQGLAVYQNGVRLNEAFGDTVNWDAIPDIAIARMDVWSANPVFGLNALGGAVSLTMKNGFSAEGGHASLQGGSFGHGQAAAEYAVQDGDFSLYVAGEGVTDGGWRLHSDSNVARLYADAGWRSEASEIHLVASAAVSSLGVVGPTPYDLAQANSAAVYTWPQTTQNRIASLALNGHTRLADHWQLEGSLYLRALRQRHLDGNDGDFESCSAKSSYPGSLCLEDDGFPAPSPKTQAFRDQFVILDQAGAPIAYTDTSYGTLDRTFTDTTGHGGTIQLTSDAMLGGLANYLTVGTSLDSAGIGFRSTSTLGEIGPDLAVTLDDGLAGSGSIIHANGNIGYAPVTLAATTTYWGLYAVDALDITDRLTLTAGLRFNSADIDMRDRSGSAPELNGRHHFSRANPMAGLTWKAADWISLFGGYSEANRAPTPLELDCADPNLPCLLEGSLVADPPLNQVVAHTGEIGARGATATARGTLTWSAGLFTTDSDNDIVALASSISGRGYFTNVPLTRRQGLDVSAHFAARGWSSFFSYSYLDATYQFTGLLASPNNPNADSDGNVLVTPGRRIPLNPAHQLRAGGNMEVLDGLTLGADLAFSGSQYLDGDPANQNRRLPAFWSVNLNASYRVAPGWEIFGLVNNLFDRHDATYGAFYDTAGAQDFTAIPLNDPRTLTLRQPISAQLGIRIAF